MTRQPRLILDDEELYPVAAFFNGLWDQNFLDAVADLADGVGRSINGADCSFPDPDDDDEPWFLGAKFSVGADEIILADKDWKTFARTALAAYAKSYPEHSNAVSELLQRLQ